MNDDDYAELFRLPRAGRQTSWDDVARSFGALGDTLGQVFRVAWERDPVTRQLDPVVRSLRTAVTEAMQARAGSADHARLREDLVAAVDTLRSMLGDASAQVRPELVSLLDRANAELRRLADLDRAD